VKRENINTIIAILGLILAVYSNYKQFKPETDKLELAINTGVIDSSELELKKDSYVPKELYGDDTRLAGPVSITLELSNNMNRPVTVKKNRSRVNKRWHCH